MRREILNNGNDNDYMITLTENTSTLIADASPSKDKEPLTYHTKSEICQKEASTSSIN